MEPKSIVELNFLLFPRHHSSVCAVSICMMASVYFNYQSALKISYFLFKFLFLPTHEESRTIGTGCLTKESEQINL